jgi:16S rRNA (uracil1498-N3)-methyltransferase
VRKIRLFTPQQLPDNQPIALDPQAAHHLASVLRARVGDRVTLFNGDGWDVDGEVTAIERRAVTVLLGKRSPVDQRSPVASHIGLCLSKGERFDWAIQKATELGVHRITPLFSERTEVRLKGDRLSKKTTHWQGIVRSACEQCQRGHIPEVTAPMDLEAWVGSVDADLKLVLHHHQPAGLPEQPPTSVALLIGPEGGLTDAEVAAAEEQGFSRWCIGPRVLRTETAPLVALTAIGARWGDLG